MTFWNHIRYYLKYDIIIMQRRNWLQKGDCLIEKYKINDLNYTFKNLPHELFYMAAAPFSGPIAILFDKNITHQFILPKNYDTCIVIFNCKGQMKKQISFDLKDRLILFQFTQDQDLLIIQASGTYHFVDPYSGQCKTGSYGPSSKERYAGCEIMKDSVVLMRQKSVGVALMTGIWQPLNSIKLHVQNPVFNKYKTQQGEEILIYLSKFYTIEEYNIKTHKKTTVVTSEILQEEWANLVAISKNKSNKLALIFHQPWKILYINGEQISKFEPIIGKVEPELIYKYKTNRKYKKMFQVGWLQNFVVFSNRRFYILYDGQNSHLNYQQNRLVFEIDSFRVYANEYSSYRTVDQQYRHLTGLSYFSQNEEVLGEMGPLYHEYKKYQNKELINIQNLSQKRQNIEEILQNILETVNLFIDPIEQVTAMKFISFIKGYFTSQINITQPCAEFRIINNLKFEYMSRMLTIKQFQFLKYEGKSRFIGILLRYNMHFIADNIFGDSASKERIFFHWAKCKIEKYNETIAFEEIQKKFTMLEKKIKGKKVFTNIARYCIDRGKMSLAYKFIEMEEHSGRKIMVCLVILSAKHDKKIVEKLLDFAEESQNSFLIYRVIKELLRTEWIENYLWVNILHGRKNVQRHYIQYLKVNRMDELLKNYYLQNKMKEELGYFGLENQFLKKDGSQLIMNRISQDYGKLLPVHSKTVQKHEANESLLLLKTIRNGQKEVSEEIVRSFRSDKQLEYLGQILLDRGEEKMAILAFSLIRSSYAYTILQRKGKFSEAMNLAFERRDKQALRQIKERCPESMEREVENRLLSLNAN